eukprot:scaffold918_cov126-Cylindrotheca_fusiformis.AAC.33
MPTATSGQIASLKYKGRCNSTTSQGVIPRSTAARSLSSHWYCGEWDDRSCSLDSTMVCTLAESKEYQKTPLLPAGDEEGI